MTPCPFPPFGSPVSAAAEPTAAAAALPGARGELQRAPPFAPFVDSSPDSAAATPAPAAAAALPGARGELQRALPLFAPFVDSSPDSAAATPAAAAAAALPGPEGLQNALMFGAAAPPAATDPAVGATTASIHGSCKGSPSGSRAPSVAAGAQTPCMPAPPARSPEGGLALDGIISTRHSPALRFSPRAGLRQPPVSDEAVLMEVEVLRIDMEAQARPVNVQKPGRLAEDIARLCTEKQSDTFDEADFAEVSSSSSIPAAEESAGGTGSSASSNGGIPEAQRAKQHEAELATSYKDFRCNCDWAAAQFASSCLDQLGRQDLRAIFHQVYPRSDGSTQTASVHVSTVLHNLHKLYWNLRVMKKGRKQDPGKPFEIPKWTLEKLDGTSVEVCRASWMKALGGSDHAHRMKYSLVCRGHSPATADGERRGSEAMHKLVSRLTTAEVGLQARKHAFAMQWWIGLLKVMCFMPNERKILIRGPSYTFMHKNIYQPVAAQVGLFLERTAWYGCLPHAVRALEHSDGFAGDENAKPLRVGRCAKHSRFPECSDCAATRVAYLAASRNPATPPEVRKIRATPRMIEHASLVACNMSRVHNTRECTRTRH